MNLCAVLVLVTGLPASGKSTFLHQAQCQAKAAELKTFPLFSRSEVRGCIAAILHLDDVLHEISVEANSDADDADMSVFRPQQWKTATQELHHRTESALRNSISSSENTSIGASRTIPFVFVEDNMHLRSMRERYHRLCRRLEDECACSMPHHSSDQDKDRPYIALLELRFITPLTVCLKRNAQRLYQEDLEDNAQPSCERRLAHVPDAVILAMDAVFDYCRAEGVASAPGDGTAANSQRSSGDAAHQRWWKWTPTTQPWSLLELDASGGDPPSAAVLVDAFFNTTLSEAATLDELAKQHDLLLCRRRRRLAEQVTHVRDSVQTHAHELDLQLRATAHAFLQEHLARSCAGADSSRSSADFGKTLSKLKKTAVQRFKAESNSCAKKTCIFGNAASSSDDGADVDATAELHEACLSQFQHAMVMLWKQHHSDE